MNKLDVWKRKIAKEKHRQYIWKKLSAESNEIDKLNNISFADLVADDVLVNFLRALDDDY